MAEFLRPRRNRSWRPSPRGGVWKDLMIAIVADDYAPASSYTAGGARITGTQNLAPPGGYFTARQSTGDNAYLDIRQRPGDSAPCWHANTEAPAETGAGLIMPAANTAIVKRPFTISTTVNVVSASPSQVLFCLKSASADVIQLVMSAIDMTLQLNGGAVQVVSSASIVTSTWQRHTWVVSEDRVAHYRGCVDMGDVLTTLTDTSQTTALSATGTDTWNVMTRSIATSAKSTVGSMSDFFVWGRAMSRDEVLAFHADPYEQRNLLRLYPMFTATAEGESNVSLDPVVVSALGTVATTGSMSATLDDATLSSAGLLGRMGDLSATLGAVTFDGDNQGPLYGALAATLDPVNLGSHGLRYCTCPHAARPPLTCTATARGCNRTRRRAALAAALADLTATAEGTVA